MSQESLSLPAQAFKDLSIFRDFPSSVLQQLARGSEEIQVKKDQMIIRKGEPGDSMYLVLRGAVMVHDEDRVLATLIAGEYFGEYALLDSYTRSASVTATQPTVLLKLTRERYNEIMERHPVLSEAILKELVKRLRHLNSMQEQLLKSNQEIKQQKQEIEEINTQLGIINEQKTQIMRILAHDLRNTLTSSISLSETLQEELKERAPDLGEYIDRITKSLWRMSRRIDRMLTYKSPVENIRLEISEFSLKELMDDLKKQFKPSAKAKKIKLSFKGDPFLVTLDRGYTRQILENLIGNAIRFSPGVAKVKVNTFEEEGKLCISITDQGPGLSAEALKPLIEPLAPDENPVKNPSDLSLSIVRRHTESMGGTVSCDSKPGQGAKFLLKFPKYRKADTEKGFWGIFKS